MPRVVYSPNNSGGSWWLKDEDWHALDRAGWDVEWAKDMLDGPSYIMSSITYTDGALRYMGALARGASKWFLTYEEGVAQFEALTGQNADAQGCACCGPPHYFYEEEDERDKDIIIVEAETLELPSGALVFEGGMSIWETSHEGPGGITIGDKDVSDEVIATFPCDQGFAATSFEGRYRITIERLED